METDDIKQEEENHTTNNDKNSKEDEQINKRSRVLSERDKNITEMVEESEGKQPKLTSAIVAPSSDKQKPDPSHKGTDLKMRNKKMFGVLVGTLTKFKTDIN